MRAMTDVFVGIPEEKVRELMGKMEPPRLLPHGHYSCLHPEYCSDVWPSES
jgi:hypothetical protein